jgi:adenine deaminase
MPDLARRLAVARGDEPADLVVRGGKVLSVFTREWLDVDVAVCDGVFAGLGEYRGREELDASGRWVVPGFIDAHMHIESSKLLVDEFARLVLPLGTTAVVADPHEIANVLGTDGVHWLADLCDDIPLDIYFMASSCVPASGFESARRPFTPGDLEGLLRRKRVLGLAEMMNFPGVVHGDPRELIKLSLARHVDGHAPRVLGRELQAYAASGIGSDHEMSSVEEGRERLRAGMWVLIREASAARNLKALLPLVEEFGPGRLAFCTDDREPEHIEAEGHVNSIVREAVAWGIKPEDALVMASFNPAVWHGLHHLGAVAPGYQADLLVLPDLERFVPDVVLKAAREVAQIPHVDVPEWVQKTVRIKDVTPENFRIAWNGGQARVIGVIPDQIVTDAFVEDAPAEGGHVVADPERDLAKIAVIERHHGTGRIGIGLVRGFRLRSGALASTFAHDAHNLVVVGMSDEDMAGAARRLAELGGGTCVVDGGKVRADLALPVAGLLSAAPLEEVVAATRACNGAAAALGCLLEAPFQSLAFLALSVIPKLKITDHGLVDVERFELVPLAAD